MAQHGHPKGLYLLFVTEMAERFSYYGMRALFVLYLVAAFFNSADASQIYGSYTGLVYLTPLLGGYIASQQRSGIDPDVYRSGRPHYRQWLLQAQHLHDGR